MRARQLLALGLVLLSAGASWAQSLPLYGLTAGGDALSNPRSIVTFNVTGSGVANLTSPAAVSGLTGGQTLQSIDFRNTTNTLYGLATDAVGTTAQFYTLAGSGAGYTATAAGATFAIQNAPYANTGDPPLLNFAFSAANQARIVTVGGQFITVDLTNPATPSVSGTGSLSDPDNANGFPGRVTAVTGATRALGATSGGLYGYNFDAAAPVTIAPTGNTPDGQQTYISTNPPQTRPTLLARQISAGLTATTAGNLYLATDVDTSTSGAELYQIDTNGNFSQIGGADVLPILYSLTTPVPEPATVLAVGVGCLGVAARFRRRRTAVAS